MNKVHNTEYADMYIEGGIAYLIYKPLDMLELDVAKVMVQDRVDFKNGISYPTLFDIRDVKSTSKEARDYLANEGSELVTASALLVSSSVTKMIGNFFITVSKPKKETYIFTDREKAIVWLNQFK